MLLEVEGLSVRFGGLRALANVSFDVAEGQIVGLVGPNGAGKSTLINAVSGALGPQAGQMRFDRHDINGLSPSRIARLGLTRTFQLVQPFRGLTAIECVTLGGLYGSEDRRPGSVAAARRLAEEALDFTGLSEVAGHSCAILNASLRRRLEIARALP